MNKRLLKQEQFKISRWSGGSTVQTGIFPDGSDYLERDFIWRLSSASVEAEESSFTRLPDYDRILMVLEGSVVLAHGEERSVSLEQRQQDSFDGAVKTKCFGTMTDYNLMFRKGCTASLKYIEAGNEASAVEKKQRNEFQEASYGFYCVDGYVIVSVDGETEMVRQGQQMVIDFDAGEDMKISIMGEGACVMAEILYIRSQHAAEEIPEEKMSLEDFKAAFKLVHGRNKWSNVLNSVRQRDVWYDEALQKKLAFLDKTYVTFFVWIVVLLIILAAAAVSDMSVYAVLTAVVVWSILHFIAVAPLIYTIVLPKPIKAHIKKVTSLNEYERGIYEAQAAGNERVDKLLRKYPSPDEENRESYREKLKNMFR